MWSKTRLFSFFPTVIVPFSFLDSIVTIFLSYCLPEVSLLSMSRSQSPNPSSLSGTHLPPLQFLSRNPQLPSPPKECRPRTLSASQCGQNTKAVTNGLQSFSKLRKAFWLTTPFVGGTTFYRFKAIWSVKKNFQVPKISLYFVKILLDILFYSF